MAKTSHSVAPRRTSFELEAVPVHWIDGDAQSTHTLNVGNLLFPTGERFSTTRSATHSRTSPMEVRRAIRGFLGQEVTHARARALRRTDARAGIDFDRALKAFEAISPRLNARVDSLPEPLRGQAVLQMLAATADAEHITASLAGYVLEDNSWSETTVDPEMQHLFL